MKTEIISSIGWEKERMELATELKRWHVNSKLKEKTQFSKENCAKWMASLCSVAKQHQIKYKELICPKAYRN